VAYIIGLLSEEEEAELVRRGWVIERAPRVFVTRDSPPHPDPSRMKMVWVDNDMFSIMNGPDWEKG